MSLLLVKNVDTDKIPAPAGALESLDEMQIKVAPQRAVTQSISLFPVDSTLDLREKKGPLNP